MLSYQFFMRLLLLVIVGIVYVRSYMNMAKRDSKEVEPKRHLGLKILGGFFAICGIMASIVSVYTLSQVTFPFEEVGPYPGTLVRPSDQIMWWGFPTRPQNICLSIISATFIHFALAAYCLMFKSSNSKWQTKLWKVIFCIFFTVFYASATDFHYFDIYEWTAPILFAVMAYFALRNKKEKVIIMPAVSNTEEREIVTNVDNSFSSPKETITLMEEEEHGMEEIPASNSTTEEQNITDVHTPIEEGVKEQDLTIKFCRHCGNRVDYVSYKFCKYCGKPLY